MNGEEPRRNAVNGRLLVKESVICIRENTVSISLWRINMENCKLIPQSTLLTMYETNIVNNDPKQSATNTASQDISVSATVTNKSATRSPNINSVKSSTGKEDARRRDTITSAINTLITSCVPNTILHPDVLSLPTFQRSNTTTRQDATVMPFINIVPSTRPSPRPFQSGRRFPEHTIWDGLMSIIINI